MQLSFGHPTQTDLPRIMQIEQAGFTPEEAASEAAMRERIDLINDSFIVARNSAGEVLGYVVGPVVNARYIHDELFKKSRANPPQGGFCAILSLAVAPECRKAGIAGQLLQQLIRQCRAAQREGITLTCLENLIPFYEKHGFQNEGISDSQHAGETWYNLVAEL
ncbi:GNAT family N-acetyltransferase [Eikenella sp. S3360]|uniref:GNAT family N-acetyltransferase n=1 Tax=Eikenella glucosivorans TaxID=2766967 RepID=A0ABS0N9I4_9NEIS|nr:GNAT family N-acetyltransferase [Eikenella glucosivorans]MBH5328971.1 GNAT family N-acetyltransferase [Eikenella glucosivorans]